MISHKEANAQMVRLTGLLKVPDQESALLEVTRVLQEKSTSVEHAARIVSRIIDTTNFFPTPLAIRELAYQCDYETQQDWSKFVCRECDSTGWREVFELITWREGRKKDIEVLSKERYEDLLTRVPYEPGVQVVTRAVKPCHCKRGRLCAEGLRGDGEEQAIKPVRTGGKMNGLVGKVKEV